MALSTQASARDRLSEASPVSHGCNSLSAAASHCNILLPPPPHQKFSVREVVPRAFWLRRRRPPKSTEKLSNIPLSKLKYYKRLDCYYVTRLLVMAIPCGRSLKNSCVTRGALRKHHVMQLWGWRFRVGGPQKKLSNIDFCLHHPSGGARSASTECTLRTGLQVLPRQNAHAPA